MVYYGLTTVWGSQTLGEEYCNTVQVGPQKAENTAKFSAPGFLRRTLAILAQLISTYTLEKLIEYLQRKLQSRSLPWELDNQHYKLLETILDTVEDVISTTSQLHLALFYIQGIFYHIGKRITSIRYLMIRYGPESGRASGYKILGWLLMFQIVLKVLMWGWRLWKWKQRRSRVDTGVNQSEETGGLLFTVATSAEQQIGNSSNETQPQVKCPLCLEICRSISATPCGHLFCWECVAEWVSERVECPVCRASVEPQQLVCLQHFQL